MIAYQRHGRSLLLATLAIAACTRAFCESTASEAPPSDSRSSCKAAIARFLEAPTADGLSAIPHHGDECWSKLKTKQLQALDALVAGGNKYAARLLAPHVRHLEGGELEDALRAVGQFATHAMPDAVDLCLSGALTEREFRDALTMLPVGLEDNFAGQLTELQTRRSAIGELADPRARELKETAAASIDAFISEVERAQSETEAQKR